MNDETINQENVTQDMIRAYFDKAYFTTMLDDRGSLFIKDKFKIYIDVNVRKTNITFSTSFLLKETCDLNSKLEYGNTINREVLQLKAVIYDKTVTIEHDFWVEGGALVRNMIAAYRSFVSQVSAALTKDTNKVLL